MSRIESLMSMELHALASVDVPNAKSQPLVLVISDDEGETVELAEAACEFLGFEALRVQADDDLFAMLDMRRPLAVITTLESKQQDACYVLMTVASYDRDLPVLVIADRNEAFLGAVDAVEEMWGLTAVEKSARSPNFGGLVDFALRAGKVSKDLHLVPV
jgi:DNA-binding NtrC family response regulator